MSHTRAQCLLCISRMLQIVQYVTTVHPARVTAVKRHHMIKCYLLMNAALLSRVESVYSFASCFHSQRCPAQINVIESYYDENFLCPTLTCEMKYYVHGPAKLKMKYLFKTRLS
jgi:hypothetical protein